MSDSAHFWDWMISAKMHLQQDIMHIYCRENIHMQKLHFPVQDCVRSSITTGSIRWMCTRHSCCRLFAHTVSLCHLQALPYRPESAHACEIIWSGIAATKISAGVSTGIGSHVEDIEDKGDDQFEISDGRSVKEVYDALLKNDLQPVMSDYIYV